MKTVLTIAGFDPSAGAGVTADLMVFAAHGLHGIAAITALTVQSTLGVLDSHPVDPAVLHKSLECLDRDVRPCGAKIGMAASHSNIRIISSYIDKVNASGREFAVVLDPVLSSSSGRALLDRGGTEALLRDLLPRVDWITPNTDELAALTGRAVRSRGGLAVAARHLQEQSGVGQRGRKLGIFAKGGHLEKPDDLLLTPEGEEHWLAGERIETDATHGTGCALSSAFLARLILGDDPVTAAWKAKDYVACAMRNAHGIGRGKGPMELLWPLRGVERR